MASLAAASGLKRSRHEGPRGETDELSLTSLVVGFVTDFTGPSGGSASLHIADCDGDASFHLVARKCWHLASGGPRIEILELKDFERPRRRDGASSEAHAAALKEFNAKQAAKGWLRTENIYADLKQETYKDWVRVMQVFPATRTSSDMAASYMLSYALSKIDESGSIVATLRAFNLPTLEVQVHDAGYGCGGVPVWTVGWNMTLDEDEMDDLAVRSECKRILMLIVFVLR